MNKRYNVIADKWQGDDFTCGQSIRIIDMNEVKAASRGKEYNEHVGVIRIMCDKRSGHYQPHEGYINDDTLISWKDETK